MKNIIKVVFLLNLVKLFAQNNEVIKSKKHDYERVYIELGMIQPLGQFKKQMDNSLHYGFWFRTEIKHQNFMDIGFNFWIPKSAQPIEVFHNGSYHIFESSDFNFSLGGRLAKVLPFSKKISTEWVSGFGVTFFPYQVPNTIQFNEEEKDHKNLIISLYLSQGIRLNYKNIGLQIHYHYMPIDFVSPTLKNDFGNSYLTVGILYRQ
jgi:hypothetical protein